MPEKQPESESVTTITDFFKVKPKLQDILQCFKKS